MNILHVCSISNNKSSGVSSVVPEHFISQKQYANTALLNCNNTIIEKLKKFDNVFYINDYKSISSLPFAPDIVIFHSFYIPKYIKLSKELIKLNIPYIIVPHGSLTLEAQKQKKVKKVFGNLFFFNNFINHSSAIQFLSDGERKQSSMIKKNSFVVGNGIKTHSKIKKHFSTNGIKMLYIGRYSIYTKGIDLILKLVDENYDFFIKNNITIDLYGTGDKEKNKIFYMIDSKLKSIIKVNGPIFDSEKEKAYLSHDIFIQLSRHEGQPLGILEAMSFGLPVFVSKGTNFEDVVIDNNLGYSLNKKEKFFKSFCLNELIKKSDNCLKFIDANYAWDKIAKSSVKYYSTFKK